MMVSAYHLFKTDFLCVVRCTVAVPGKHAFIAAVIAVFDYDDIYSVNVSYFLIIVHDFIFSANIEKFS